jgi:hypothetical protein
MSRTKGAKNLEYGPGIFRLIEKMGVDKTAKYYQCSKRAIYYLLKRAGKKIEKKTRVVTL